MSGRPGAFHRKHGSNIRLYEEETVAHRVDSYNKAVVFSEQTNPHWSYVSGQTTGQGRRVGRIDCECYETEAKGTLGEEEGGGGVF